jgi:uncharacterized RDD family membrane protein YckC
MTFEWGHLLMLIRFDKRTLHDILAGTRVVRKSAPAVSTDAEPEVEEDIDSDSD